MVQNHLDVMLSQSEASAFPAAYEKADSSAAPQNDILKQFQRGMVWRFLSASWLFPSQRTIKACFLGPRYFPLWQRGIKGGFISALAAVLFMLAGALAPSVATAQASKEYQLKAVFLWRLAQFTQWPSDAFDSAESPIVICVLGENPFGDALNAAIAGETAHGRKLIVQQHRVVEQIKSCHVLYLTGAGPRQAKAIVAVLGGKSILTVRDDGVASAYDTIVGFLTEQNRIKLRINVKAATAARLVLDARLLRAAEIVDE